MPSLPQNGVVSHKKNDEHMNKQVVPIDIFFPEDDANKLAKIEVYNKHLYRPNTYLHKWWARRCGTTFRYILKQLVEDSEKRDFYSPGGLDKKIVYDPMMGGGTTIHEAIRMGANVIGIDIDPIPVLQTKAALMKTSIDHKNIIYKKFYEKLRSKISSFYNCVCFICGQNSEIKYVLYGLRRRCSCGEAIFVDTFTIRQYKDHNVIICPDCHEIFSGSSHTCLFSSDIQIVLKGTKICDKCNSEYTDIINEPFYDRYIPLVIVGHCKKHGEFFKSLNKNDYEVINDASSLAKQIDWHDLDLFSIPKGPKSKDLLKRCISSYIELFTPRQLLYIHTATEVLFDYPNEDRLWLALLISTSLDFNCLLCGYKGHHLRRPGAVRHVFSHHAYSIPYMALENNPIFSKKASGNLNQLFNDRILRAGKWAINPKETFIKDDINRKIIIEGEIDGGEEVFNFEQLKHGKSAFYIRQGDSTIINLPEALVDFVVTDPPYYDSVQYSDLSNFFRVWLRRFLPNQADWQYDSSSSVVAQNNDYYNSNKYGDLLTKIWKNCYKVLKKERGRLIFTFHQWGAEAWAELSISLMKVGFELVNRYVVISENPSSVHIFDLKALKHDVILVLRPVVNIEKRYKWTKPTQINFSSSHAFCQDCGTMLGWCLSSDLDEDNIRQEWKHIIGVLDNGKVPG